MRRVSPNFAVRNTERQARETAWKDARDEYKILQYNDILTPFENAAEWEAFGESLPIVWINAEDNPMMRPINGKYLSGEPYSKELDTMFGNFDGMAHVVLKDCEGKVLEYVGFEMPSKCLKCFNLRFCQPINHLSTGAVL